MLQIGLSGGIGSGKTTVAQLLEKMGYPVFYSDQEAKKSYDQNEGLKRSLIDLFGESIYKNGIFQKEILAQILFNEPTSKDQIAALVHPLVREAFQVWAQQQTSDLVFNEAAILFETGAHLQFDATILVLAPLEIRIERVQKRDSLSREEVLRRVANQWTDAQKMALTPYHVVNDGRPLLIQVEQLIAELRQKLKI